MTLRALLPIYRYPGWLHESIDPSTVVDFAAAKDPKQSFLGLICLDLDSGVDGDLEREEL